MTYAVETAQAITDSRNIVVLTDDEEIDLVARRLSVSSVIINISDKFPLKFGESTTLKVLAEAERTRGEKFEFIIWLSPSSPLLKARDITEAVQELAEGYSDAVFSASDEPRREWLYDATYQPAFIEIPNTQRNGLMHRETGAFFIMKRDAIGEDGYIGKKGSPFFLKESHAIEIHSFHDWWVVEKLLKRKQILFVVAGYPQIGMGHVYRSLMLAQEFHDHEVRFLCTHQSRLAFDYISEYLYPTVQQQKDETLSEAVTRLSPDLVINDILDTPKDYIRFLKNERIKVINFEDRGEGASYADVVINALYEQALSSNMLSGHEYFCLRSEFLTAAPAPFRKKVKNVLITFGGTDDNNLTLRILKILLPLSLDHYFSVNIINGPGYVHRDSLREFLSELSEGDRKNIFWSEDSTMQISEYMVRADFAITSAGRTVHELASLKVPAVVIAANRREQFHTFGIKAGMSFLGIHDAITDIMIREEMVSLLTDSSKRKKMKHRLAQFDLTQGKNRVVGRILDILTKDSE